MSFIRGLKQKVLRSYLQAEENACSFTDLRMTSFRVDARVPVRDGKPKGADIVTERTPALWGL